MGVSPVSARFTTVDPIRDGSNWFSYVVNDPVNYVDPFGLTASDSRTVRSGDTLSGMTAQFNKENGTNYTWQQIGEYNNLANPHLIIPGQTINFPGRSTTTTTTATTATQTEATPTATTQTISFAYTPSVSMPSNSAPSVSTGFMARPSIQKNTNSDGGKPFDNETVLTTSFNSSVGESKDTAEGKLIHKMISIQYELKHKGETVYSNKSMATTMYKLGIVDKGLGKTDLAVRPDIWNVTTNEIYEIKPSTQGVVVAQEQLMFYIALANKYGLKGVKAGSSNAPGTSDTITLPDMSVVYWSPEPGVILYSKNKITNSSQFEYNVNIQSNPNNAVFWTIAFCFFWSLGVPVIP